MISDLSTGYNFLGAFTNLRMDQPVAIVNLENDEAVFGSSLCKSCMFTSIIGEEPEETLSETTADYDPINRDYANWSDCKKLDSILN